MINIRYLDLYKENKNIREGINEGKNLIFLFLIGPTDKFVQNNNKNSIFNYIYLYINKMNGSNDPRDMR